MAKILVIDDNETLLLVTEKHLVAAGHEVITTTESLGVSKLIREHKPDLVLVDQMLPALSGGGLIKALRRQKIETKVLLHSNLDEVELSRIARECGADGFILKIKGMSNLVSELKGYL